MPRLFVAVWPPPDVRAVLNDLPRDDEPGVRYVPPENWHVTLRFLGTADPAAVSDALDRATADAAGARACLGPAVMVLARQAIVVPVAGLDTLAAAVAEHTTGIGTPPPDRFRGHLTLARFRRDAPRPRGGGPPVCAAFDVSEVALVESHLGSAGAAYETLRTWPLRSPKLGGHRPT